jgi:hypothetical protein
VGSDGADPQENGWYASRSGGRIRSALGQECLPVPGNRSEGNPEGNHDDV